MFRRSLIIIISLLLVAATGWVVFSLEKASKPTPDPILSLADNAVFIWQIQPGHNSNFGVESKALAELLDPEFEGLIQLLNDVDSIRQQNSVFQSLLLHSALTLSLHETPEGHTWVISAANHDNLAAVASETEDAQAISGVARGVSALFSTRGELQYFTTEYRGYPLVKFGGISQLTLGPTLLPASRTLLSQDSVFTNCYAAANQNGSNLFFKRDTGWVLGEMEVDHGATNLHFVDFQQVDSSSAREIHTNADEIIPSSSKRFRSHLLEPSAQLNRAISEIEDSCACDVTAFMVDEISHFTTFDFDDTEACALHYPSLLDRLNSFSQLVGPTIDQEFGYPIFRFLHPTFFSAIGQSEKLVWLTYTHDYLIAMPTRQGLSDYLSVLSTGQVRANETGTAFLNSTLPAGYISEERADPEAWFPLHFDEGILRVYPASSTGSYFALSIPSKNQTHDSQSPSGPQWASPCDGLSRGPWLVKNHYTNEGEILWQDNSNVLHLISSTGKELWNATIDDQVLGEVSQLDIYKNGKLQLIFSTSSSIYCLDRNGRLVDNFPIRLPGQASCPLAIVDYDSDRDYRLIQSVEDGRILNYKVDGKQTRGWKFRKADTDIQHVEHIRIRAKDYVFALEESGEIHLLKRNGGSRYKSKARAKQHRGEDIYFIKGSTIGSTKMIYPDDAGNIVSLRFDQDVAEYGLTGLSSGSNLTLYDINDDRARDFLVADGNELKVYDSNFKKLFSTELPAPITFGPKVFSFSRTDKKIGAVCGNQMYLIDNQGEISPGFPKPGNDGFLIYDLDRNGSMEVIGALNGALISSGLGD